MIRIACASLLLTLTLSAPTYGQGKDQQGIAANAAAAAAAAATAKLAVDNAKALQEEQDAQRKISDGKQQGPGAALPTLRAYARLVTLDVVVTNQGTPVTGLKQSDFSVYEGKTLQTIKSFEAHAPADAPSPGAPPKLPAGVFSNQTTIPASGVLNVILIDTLNTPLQDQTFARQQLLDYLKTAKAGSNTAIFGLTTRLNMLQGFTTDPELLRRVIDKKLPQSSTLLDNPAGGGGVQDTLFDQLADAGVGGDVGYNFASFEALNQAYLLNERITYTLDALNSLARYLSGIPGRKNLIWFSGSFPINILPDPDANGDPFAGSISAEQEFRETSNLLSRSQVAVYPIDVRGLLIAPSFSAATSGARYGRNGTNFGKDQTAFASKTTRERSTMVRMAEDTGGQAFVGTNGLAEAVAKAVNFGSTYYTLTYTPAEAASRESYRSIQVKLARSGYTLSYRRGYFGDDPADPSLAGGNDAVRRAAKFGAPPATQVVFKTLVRLVNHDAEAAPAEGNAPELTAKDSAKGPWSRYLVRFSVDANTITIAPPVDGKRKVDLEFVTLVYGPDGARINSVDNTVNARLPAASVSGIQQSGLLYQQQISAPASGEYRLRILVNDRLGNRLGSVEAPLAAIKNLPLAMPQANASAAAAPGPPATAAAATATAAKP